MTRYYRQDAFIHAAYCSQLIEWGELERALNYCRRLSLLPGDSRANAGWLQRLKIRYQLRDPGWWNRRLKALDEQLDARRGCDKGAWLISH